MPGAPFAPPAAAGQARCRPGLDAQLAAQRVLERDRASGATTDPDRARDAGIALLVLGRRDEAIAHLESIAPAKATAAVLIALAAIYLDDAARDASAAALAVDLSERAARLEPGRPEAWFNRALALERLGLTAAAATARQHYLTLDGASDWAKEIRRRTARAAADLQDWPSFRNQMIASGDIPEPLLRDMVSRATDRCRELLEDDVLRSWAEAVLGNAGGGSVTAGPSAPSPPLPARLLENAGMLAAALHDVRGDRTFLDQVQHIEAVSRTAPGAARMARATLAGIRARAAIDRGDAEAARPDLAIARHAFANRLGAAHEIEFYSLMADYYRAHYAKAIGGLKRLIQEAKSRHHLYIESRATFVLAAIAVREARVSDALVLYQEATDLFTRGAETGYLASAQAIVSARYREQGDRAAAWHQLREALALLDRIETPRHLTAVLRTGQTAAVEQRLTGLAVHFTSALVELSERSRNANTLIPALADQVRQQALTRDADGARRSLERARTALARVTDPNMGPVLSSMIARAEAALLAQSSPCDAAVSLSHAIDTVTRVVPNQLAATFLERGRAYRACGRVDEAIADFRSGIRVFEEQRAGQRGAQLRISRFDQVWDLYGELIGLLALHRGRPHQALLVSEQARARELAEALGSGGATTSAAAGAGAGAGTAASLAAGGSVDVTELQTPLPDRTTVVSYVVLPNDLLVWSVTRTSEQFMHVKVQANDLTSLIAAWRAAVIDGQDDRRIGRRLFELLVQPIASTLVQGGHLIVIADGPLHELPMAGLWDGERYLVERASVWSAPSLRLFAWASARVQARRYADSRSMAIGDPAFSSERFPRLPRLRDAAREATAIASFYPAPTLLVGRDATKARILAGMQHADIVHLAAHAIADLATPSRSFIVTAAASAEDGETLTLLDIEQQLRNLPTRLLVLSACQTATGRTARGEGMISLARAFMSVGVPVILANLWESSDRASYPLFVDLHRHLASGQPAAEALRAAQLRSLRSDKEEERLVRTWAGVVGLGATGPIALRRSGPAGELPATHQD